MTGGSTDVIRKVCENLNHECKFIVLPLTRALKMLEDGEVDGVLSLSPNEERKAYSNNSPTIIVSNMSYLGTDKTPKISSIKDLSGWNVGVVRASTSYKIVKKDQEEVKSINLVEEVDSETLVKKLSGGRYGDKGVIFGSEDVLKFFGSKNKIKIESMLKIKEQEFAVAFSKKKFGAADFAAFTKTLEELKTDGTIKKILEKYNLKTN